MAEEIAMSTISLPRSRPDVGIFGVLRASLSRRRSVIILFTIGFPVVFYLLLLAALVVEYGHLPNYVTRYDWIANVLRIIHSTGSVSDMVPIILNEWLLEIGYLDYHYGHGVADWSLSFLPHKLLLLALSGALIGLNFVLLAQPRAGGTLTSESVRTCRSGMLTGIGAVFSGLTSATVFSVACCAAPSWVGSLAVLGLETSATFALEPYGPLASALGIATLAGSALWLARENRASLADSFVKTRRAE
jgi:hypothetical protein